MQDCYVLKNVYKMSRRHQRQEKLFCINKSQYDINYMEYDISNKHMFVANYKLMHIHVFVSFFISHNFLKISLLVNCCLKYMCIHCVRSMPTDFILIGHSMVDLVMFWPLHAYVT